MIFTETTPPILLLVNTGVMVTPFAGAPHKYCCAIAVNCALVHGLGLLLPCMDA